MMFTIYKGFHYCNKSLYKLFNLFNDKKRMSYYVTFNETALYVDDTLDRFDVNKLFGFSLGMHHKNSYRFGWNCLDGKIHIYAYAYVNGERIITEICKIKINEEHRFTIFMNNTGKCVFTVIDSSDNIHQAIVMGHKHKEKLFGYKLWPYFGGNKPAPQKIEIDLIEN
jgi:hypothetical protein